MASSVPPAPDPTALLDPERRPDLPVGISLDLIRMPVVLAVRQRVRPTRGSLTSVVDAPAPVSSTPAALPLEFTRAEVTLVERGVRRTVVVEGSPTLGLPYGDDADVLMALFRLVHDDYQRVLLGHQPQVIDGEFLSPSLSMIANALQMQRGGSQRRHVREALERLANVRIRTSAEFFRDTGALAERIREGDADAQPIIPQARLDRAAPGKRLAQTEAVTWLLEYQWRRDYSRTDDGEDWITRLRLNAAWCNHAASGWVAWIELPVFRALGPAAKRLYMHLAARAACDGLALWVFDAEELVRTCAPSAPSNAQALKYVREAARALEKVGVVSASQESATGRRDRRFPFPTGPVLTLAAHLRGTGSFDPDDVRLQHAVLSFLGVDPREARRWLTDSPTATRDAICFGLFVRETNPGRVRASWPAMLRDRVTNGRTNAGEVGYEAWAARRLAAGPAEHVFPAPPLPAAGPERAPRRARTAAAPDPQTEADAGASVGRTAPDVSPPVTPPAPDGTPEAVDLWRQVREGINPGQTLLALSCLDALAPVAIEDDVLVVHDTVGVGEYAIRNLGAQLGEFAAAATNGRVVAVRRRPVGPAAA